nr:RecName: Full=Acidic lectin A1 [Psophocarpus scandens]
TEIQSFNFNGFVPEN